jgi:hypothetical protein
MLVAPLNFISDGRHKGLISLPVVFCWCVQASDLVCCFAPAWGWWVDNKLLVSNLDSFARSSGSLSLPGHDKQKTHARIVIVRVMERGLLIYYCSFSCKKKMSALHPIFCLFQPCMTSNICRRYLMPRLFFSKERWIPWNSIEKQKKLDHKLCRIVIENNSSSQFWSRLKLPTFILYGGNINNTLKSVYKLIINLFHRGNRPNHFWSWYIS